MENRERYGGVYRFRERIERIDGGCGSRRGDAGAAQKKTECGVGGRSGARRKGK